MQDPPTFLHSLETGPLSRVRVLVTKPPGTPSEVAVLIHGQPEASTHPLVRIQSRCTYAEVFESVDCDCGGQLSLTWGLFREAGHGILLYLEQEGRGCGLLVKAAAYELMDTEQLDTVAAYARLGVQTDQRRYDGAAKVLDELGVGSIRLLTNNPLKVAGLTEFGVEVVEVVPLRVQPTPSNIGYLRVKQEKLGHDLGLPASVEP